MVCSVVPPSLHRQDMEQQLGSLILATDISRQNEFLMTFREHLDNQDLDLQLASHRHFMLQVCCTPPPAHYRMSNSFLVCSWWVSGALDLQIALKCADVCNPCRVWELSRQWSERVCEEFYRQGESGHVIEILKQRRVPPSYCAFFKFEQCLCLESTLASHFVKGAVCGFCCSGLGSFFLVVLSLHILLVLMPSWFFLVCENVLCRWPGEKVWLGDQSHV